MDPIGVTLALIVGTAAYLYVGHRQRMDSPDGAVILQLKKAGSDVGKPHQVDFFFTAQKAADLEAVAAELQADGYSTRLSEATPSILCATKPVIPRVRTMLRLRKQLSAIAIARRAEYDGWGAPVVLSVAG
jgi:hypothetical protein